MKYLTKINNITNKKSYIYILLIILIALFFSAPLYSTEFYKSHDSIYHISRNYSTNSGILSKQFPPLIEPTFVKGFGYAWNIFYPPLETYISGIFSIFTSILTSLKLTVILSIISSGITMFALIKKITKNNDLSLLTAVIYMSAPYFFCDIYVRVAMGEIIAYAFFPLLFYGLYDIFYDNGKQNYFLTIGALGIILSHNISALMAIIISFIFVLLHIKKLFSKNSNLRIWKNIIINSIFIILVSTFFYGPFLEHKLATNYSVYTNATTRENFINTSIQPSQLFFSKSEAGYVSFEFGLPIIIGLLFTPAVISKIKLKKKMLYIYTLCTGILFSLMSTSIFPWASFPIVPSIMQFTWRFLLVSTFLLSIIAGVNIYYIIDNIKSKDIYIILMIIILYSSNYIQNSVRYNKEFNIHFLYNSTDLLTAQCGIEYEYLPTKAHNDLDYIRQRSSNVIITSGTATIENEQKDESNMTFTIKESSENTTLELPYIYYLGYNIKINGTQINYNESDKGFIQITVPTCDNAIVEVTYTGTKLEKISLGISIISFLAFIGYIVYTEKNKKHHSWCFLQNLYNIIWQMH